MTSPDFRRRLITVTCWLGIIVLQMVSGQTVIGQSSSQDGDQAQGQNPKPQTGGQEQPASGSVDDEIAKLSKTVEDLKAALNKDQDPDFALVLGLGSLLIRQNVSDYKNEANVLQATSLGRATPQLLAGVSFRTHMPSPLAKYRGDYCQNGPSSGGCELWLQHPWSAFVSFKFSPGSSQVINGYVLGGSFAIARHIDVLVGYSLTPINEPSPGLRSTAYQYVTSQQKAGQLMTFSPAGLAANNADAFDGFSLTDSTGKLIYAGNPLTVHYHGSTLIGVSIPIYFKSVLGK